MALLHKNISEIPKDAVRISEKEALEYFSKIIDGWKNKSEIWALAYTPGILSGAAVCSSVYMNNYFRNKLKLGNYGRLTSYLPAVALPAIMGLVFHTHFVVPDVILNRNKCPVCVQTRAGLIQAGFSTAYPMLLVPLSAFMFATRHFTYRLPSAHKEPLEVLKLVQKLFKPITMQVTVMLAFNVMLAMFLTNKEFEAVHRINFKLIEMEKKLESGELPLNDSL
ncbi:uncharacterized protein LOC129763202 [Toxorhynchites rutilus septentrionalis]|uniref:uncharacterized protein LOC129763202 n=1 Tax=Toxorhynchites rutilus septentrionalis TaxID=329112 RepID=UPI002479D823|nr:uncharacterized protein LOC129763202 [Toxorhynchites rutilus septentrionalis]